VPPLPENNTFGGKLDGLYRKPGSSRLKNTDLKYVWEDNTVAYALKARKPAIAR
jgi:hypothetical protein